MIKVYTATPCSDENKKKTAFRRQTKTQTNISEYGYINIKIDKMEVK